MCRTIYCHRMAHYPYSVPLLKVDMPHDQLLSSMIDLTRETIEYNLKIKELAIRTIVSFAPQLLALPHIKCLYGKSRTLIQGRLIETTLLGQTNNQTMYNNYK